MSSAREALIGAARNGDTDRIALLLAGKRAHVDDAYPSSIVFGKRVVSITGCTPLMAASAEGKIDAASFLLSAGANPNYQTPDGFTALHVAAYMDRSDVIALLVKNGADLNLRLKSSETPLFSALSLYHYEAARTLIKAGADIHIVDGYMRDTPLHRAVYTSRIDKAGLACIRALVQAGADMNARNAAMQTPLHYAAAGDPQTVRVLLDAGADLHASDFMQRTPLHHATDKRKTIRMLLDAGADVNLQDRWGRTVLFDAVTRRDAALVRELLDAGADPNLNAEDGLNVLAIASQEGDKQIYRLLLQRGAGKEHTPKNLNDLLCAACANGEAARAAELLAQGADADATKEHESALMLAARGGDSRIVRSLLQAGATVGKENASGQTALHYSAEKGSSTVVEQLLQSGAVPDKPDEDGWTPLMFACKSGNVAVVSRLIKVGANIRARAKDGMEPFLIAARSGHARVASLLKKAGAKHALARHFLEIPEFRKRLKQPEFQKAIRELSRICGSKPMRTPAAWNGAVFFDLSKSKLIKNNQRALQKQLEKEFVSRKELDDRKAKQAAKHISELNAVDRTIHFIINGARSRFLKKKCLLLFVHQLPGNKLALVPTLNPLAAVAWLGPHPKGPLKMLEFLLILSKHCAWKLYGCSYDELRIQISGRRQDPAKIGNLLCSLHADEKGILENGIVRLATSVKQFSRQLASHHPIVRLWWD